MKVCNLRKIVAWLLWGMVFVATLEFCARLDDSIRWEAPFFGLYSNEILWQPTAWGRGGRPNAKFEKWEINSQGFRSSEINRHKPNHEIRVLVMGASETFGLYESSGHAFPELLDKNLNRVFPGCYKVINTGFPGMSLPRMCKLFQVVAEPLQPDIVVVYPSPQFYLDVRPPAETFTNRNSLKKDRGNKLELRLKRKLTIILKRILPSSLQTVIRRLALEYMRVRLGVKEAWERPPRKRLEAFNVHLVRLVQEIRAVGCEVILATHANRFGTDLDCDDDFYMYAWIVYYPLATPGGMLYMEASANDIIRDVGEKYRIPVVDLADVVSGRSENFADFSHFTDQGSDRVAKTLAKAVVNLISPDHTIDCR